MWIQDEEVQKLEKDKMSEMELAKKHKNEYEALAEKHKNKLELIKDEKEALEDLQEELEMRDDTINTYLVRDRQQNDEIIEAHRAALVVHLNREKGKKIDYYFLIFFDIFHEVCYWVSFFGLI